MVDVRSLTAAFSRSDDPSKHKQDNATRKSKRGGRRVNRNESFEDLFSGNAFEDNKARTTPDDEVSLNSSQISFQAPFSSSKSNLETSSRSHFCGESDEEMSGDEDPFANIPKRRGTRKKGHNDIDYDAGSVDFNDGDFDFNNESTDEQHFEAQDSETSFSWTKPEGEARKHERANEFNSTIARSSLRKEKTRIPLSTVITATPGIGSPVSSIASSSIVSRQKNKVENTPYKGSSTTSPTSALDMDAFEEERRSPPEPPIDTNTPEGVAGNYVMAPSRSRAQSRSRATSRGRNPRAASRSRSRVRGGELKPDTRKEVDFHPVFPNSIDTEVEEDLFAGKDAAERSVQSKNRDPGSNARFGDPASTSNRSRSKNRSRDSESEPPSSSRARSKSRSRGSEPESSSSRAHSKSRVRESERESSSSRARSKSRSRKSTTTDSSATAPSSKKVTRIKIKAKRGGKLDPATAKRLVAEKMKELKDSGDTSESTSALEAMKELFIAEKNEDSANFNQSIQLGESSNHIDLSMDEIGADGPGAKKHKKKNKEVGDKTKSRKHKSKDSSEPHDSFTDSVLSKSSSSLNTSSRLEDSFQISTDLTSAFNASTKLTTHREEETDDRKERNGRSRSKSPEKKHRSRGRSEGPMKKSKERTSETKVKERSGRSKSPTKKHRERSESPHKRSKEVRRRSNSPLKKSKEERARSKSRARIPKE